MDVSRLEPWVSEARQRYRTAEDMVIGVLREAIVTGVFSPGERLPQDQLADLLMVSRMPIRAALRQLDSEGLVVNIPHRGAKVRELSPSELRELYELRVVVECFALRRSVLAATADDLPELMELAERCETAEEGDDWINQRCVFYRHLYSIGNGARVVDTIMALRAEVSRYLLGKRFCPGWHRELMETMVKGEPEEAARFLEDHLMEVLESMEGEIAAACGRDAAGEAARA
ncbi:MAG: GntR family transcriptional regulator [bacterium]|nr:GntR family transcriptional regulator [bacterium]MDE0600903.1 GntR family transcriptional regulator [bacterium]